MIMLNSFKRFRFLITLISMLIIFISGFYILENIYLGRSNAVNAVILEKELFSSSNQAGENKTVTEDNKEYTGSVEYTKRSFVFKESGETIITESWINPRTLESRTNEVVTTAGNKVEKNYTAYAKDGASHYINILRDQNGKAISGREFYYSQERASANSEDLKKYDTFAGWKTMYNDAAGWKNKGTVISEGKTLKKVLFGNEKEGNTTCVYIDEATGFPVKEEAYVNGKLHSTTTYEFKYVDNDEKIFDASSEGIELEQEGLIKELNTAEMAEKLKGFRTRPAEN